MQNIAQLWKYDAVESASRHSRVDDSVGCKRGRDDTRSLSPLGENRRSTVKSRPASGQEHRIGDKKIWMPRAQTTRQRSIPSGGDVVSLKSDDGGGGLDELCSFAPRSYNSCSLKATFRLAPASQGRLAHRFSESTSFSPQHLTDSVQSRRHTMAGSLQDFALPSDGCYESIMPQRPSLFQLHLQRR